MYVNSFILKATLISVICLMLEVLAVQLSYEHEGLMYSYILAFIVLLFTIIIAILFFFRLRKAMFILSLIVLVAIVPKELYLGYRHLQVKQECNHIISFLDSEKSAHNAFPNSLSDYKFDAATAKKFINYEKVGKDNYQLRYHLGYPASAMHFYNYKDGYGWLFSDD